MDNLVAGLLLLFAEGDLCQVILPLVGIAAALLLMVGGVSALGLWRLENTAVASVSLDVNPSVEIKVNEKEKVVSVTALNEDGQQVIANMDFEI